jgi:phosphatidylglycerol lysyltransferase
MGTETRIGLASRARQALPVAIGVVLFVAALEVIRVELRTVTWPALVADVEAVPPHRLLLALLLTAANYVVLTGYDLLAFAYIGKRLSRVRVLLTSLLAYAIANNVGFAMLSGASVRFRFYTRWGVTNEELSRIVFSYSTTFWLGLLALGGLSLAVAPLPAAAGLPEHRLILPAGVLLMAMCAAYVGATIVRRAPLRLGRFELTLPTPRIAVAQLLVSALDWTLAGAVLFVLLPPSDLTLVGMLGAFLAAQLLGLASHVPGGVGVFEGLMLILLRPSLSSGQLLPALVVFRLVYYLVPLTLALVALVADELRQRRAHAARVSALLGRMTGELAPRLLAIFAFIAGLVLLFSGATPAAEGRLAWLDRFVPLGIIEASHFIGSVVGALLLVLSHGLARRLDAACCLSMAAAAAGIVASLLKGADVEEAAFLGFVFVLLWRARPAFDRRAAFFEARFSAGWFSSVVAAVAASVWLGLFAFKHVDYSHELWWQFELWGEASRFLRASVGVSFVVLLFAFRRLLWHARYEAVPPTDEDLDAAGRAIAQQRSGSPFLVYLRDKTILFDRDRAAFVMYGVQGRTWVAMGEPVGPAGRVSGLVRCFLERCDDYGGIPVFYEIGPGHLHLFADFGLAFVKMGEEASVDLRSFSLEGPAATKFRQAVRRLERDGGTFRLIDPGQVPRVLDDLKSVSDDWLGRKAGSEKGFSLGFFDAEYLGRFPVAVVERSGRIVAFSNLWPGPGRTELSIDLMRYHHDAPKGVIEAMFVHLMVWGRQQGYERFTLGMAPLSGFEASPIAPLWNRLGAFLYEHGEALYNFQGLRAFKDKFNPTWEPRYLAYPGGLRLPLILADVSALIAGGYRRMLLGRGARPSR